MFALHPYQNKLLSQARQALSKGKHSVLLVSPAGSGKSVIIAEIARLTVSRGGHVLFMVHRKELVEQITESFIQNEVDLEMCTIMTVGRIINRLDVLPKPALIITDESHHSPAKTYRRIYDFHTGVPMLGFTASPWRMSGKGFTDIYEAMVEGESVEWLIENKYLAPYTYYSVQLSDSEKLSRSSTGDYTKASIDNAISRTIFGDVIKTYTEKASGKSAIVYCHSVEFSKFMADKFNEAGINASHADAKTPKREREKIMDGFRNGTVKILCNVDLISEGFNVPDCGVVILLRPTESLVLHIQQSMRGMRYKPGKHAIIIDHVANYAKHGLPDTPREWKLEGWKENKGNSRGVESSGYKQCPDCFTVIKSALPVCDVCGHVFAEENEMKVQEAELVEIKQEFKLETDYAATKPLSEIQTMAELKAYQKAKGYKPGWVYFQAKLKKLIK